ncbi:RagB/SusD family nutrient uptake outer membrane protein [Membranihabitans marinus]|uniref:RagB/SusD family nutrient uptake outer membrane protein n=1 Tax=Membranihabitans marinus TaxID=1227546 RepID=UPI001F21EC43|nr:RagB/SusD family nutrient uptake outer membrane protein [Membranihabitans marinus]
MKNIKIYSLLILVILMTSCENVLDVDIKSSIVAGNFPANGEEAKALLIGSYRQLKNTMNSTTYHIDRSDAFEVGKIGTVSQAWAQNLNAGNGPSWTGYYSALYDINYLLDQVDQLDFNTESLRDQTKAEAYFLRAFYYFQMVKIWGEVPLITTPLKSIDQEVVGRSPISEVMEQINSDLNLSIQLFPNSDFDNKNFASKPASYALQADIKMWSAKVLNGGESDIDDALEAIAAVESAGVELLDDFASVFDVSNKNNSEIIFALYNDRNEYINHFANSLTPRTDIDFNSELSPWVPSSPSFARHNYSPSKQIRDLFDNENDTRKDASFVPMLQADGDDENDLPDTSSFSQNKFIGELIDGIRQYTNDIILYRWSDLLLLRAEAYVAKNDIDNAIIALNKVRNRANIGDYSGNLDIQSVNRAILDERGRELFLEQKRWWDLRRFHADNTIDIYDFVPNLNDKDVPLYWPVSQAVISLNPKVEQTSGY